MVAFRIFAVAREAGLRHHDRPPGLPAIPSEEAIQVVPIVEVIRSIKLYDY
jgi:hypothetical protein